MSQLTEYFETPMEREWRMRTNAEKERDQVSDECLELQRKADELKADLDRAVELLEKVSPYLLSHEGANEILEFLVDLDRKAHFR